MSVFVKKGPSAVMVPEPFSIHRFEALSALCNKCDGLNACRRVIRRAVGQRTCRSSLPREAQC
jgi:hypothetical protein